MTDEAIPQWALDEAKERLNAEVGSPLYKDENDATKVLARMIVKHEKPPVDPDEEAVRDMRERAAKEADDFWGVDSAAHMTLLEMLKREQPMAASYSWLRNDCGMPATATIIKSVPDIIAALEAAEKMALAAARDMRERAAKEAEDFWGVDSAADRIRALPLGSK